jgi:TonB-linked SusC/RagA family outer membrane protein
MKLTALLMLIICLQVRAAGFSQTITLHEKDVPLAKVFNQIEQQSGYTFAFTATALRKTKNVSLSVTNETLVNVLAICFKDQSLEYTIIDKTIIVRPAKEVDQHLDHIAPSVILSLTVKGKVSDENGKPLADATIALKGSSIGTSTDVEGKFSINIPDNSSKILVFSYVGRENKEIKISSVTLLDVRLLPLNIQQEQVVVVGYGTVKKGDVTTSVARVSGEEIKNAPVVNFDQALAGRMAGVQVLQNSGKPNAPADIRVRGTGSITAGIDPLYVVDGVPYDRGSVALEIVDANDIESIEVLKDASSAAIYGSRGANGVVIITTKSGKSGKMKVDLNAFYGIQDVAKKIPMLDAYQYAAFSKDGHDNAYLGEYSPSNPNNAITGLPPSVNDPNSVRPNSWDKTPPELFPYLQGTPGLTNTNWQDQIFRTAPMYKASLAMSGGNDNSRYYVAGNVLSQDGIIINSDYKRYGARLKYSAKSGKVKLDVNVTPSYSIENRVNSDDSYNNEGIVQAALASCPIWPVYNPDGSFNYQGNGYWRLGTDYQHNEVINPVAEAMLIKNNIIHANVDGAIALGYEIFKNLDFKTSGSVNYNQYYNEYYRPSTLPNIGSKYALAVDPYYVPSNPLAKSSSTYFLDWVWENTLTYKKTFNNSHHLNILGGFTSQREKSKAFSVSTTGATNDLLPNIAGGTSAVGKPPYSVNEWTLMSYLSRVQYDYKSKYLLSAAIRADGSSRFGSNNKWGYFPSISAGWKISSEEFMKDITWISSLKLKASYGISGNFKIGNYQQTALLSNNYNADFGLNEALNQGTAPTQFANPDLTWEKTAMTNLGIEAYFLNDRIGIETEIYNGKTYDLLLNLPVPTITGFGTATTNIGSVNNRGLEASLIINNPIGKLVWRSRSNISVNINKVKNLGANNTPIITTAGGVASAYFKTEVGQPIGNIYGLKYDGIFKDQKSLDNYPHFSTSQIGDFKFVDVDGDGVLDVTKDRTIIGNYIPKFTYSFVNDFIYKGFDLSIAFQGVYGNKILNLSRRYIANIEGNVNNMTLALDRYRNNDEPGNGLINRANRKSTGNNSTISSYHVEDGSYLRLQNITLGYNVASATLSKIKVQKIRIYVSGQNLWTLTKYSGYNPEVNLYNSNQLTPGVDYGSYPLSKTLSFGINASF